MLNPSPRGLVRLSCLFTLAILYSPFRLSAEPVLFVTQTPFSFGNPAIGSVFGNHQGIATLAPRGGDLCIRYDDGAVRNLTQELGYGVTPGQEITVRDPAVHWGGAKALFSMVIGGTTPGDLTPVFFQIYEITGILEGQTAAITDIPQPAGYNNVSPVYAPDGRILFTSDRPRNGDSRLYPLHDEYRGQLSNTGLWIMAADGTGLRSVDPNPSGDFGPIFDSFGRIILSRWDHLERDQQADADIDAIITALPPPNHAETFAAEDDFTSHTLSPADEYFPQLAHLHPNNAPTPDPVWDTSFQSDELPFEFNRFFPWAMDTDGTSLEILNHLGRHELNNFVPKARTTLPNFGLVAGDPNVYTRIFTFMAIREDQMPANAGTYYGVSAPEFNTHGAGQIVKINAPPTTNADFIRAEYITYYETGNPGGEATSRGTYQVGMFRDPMPRADGTLWAVHSNEYRADSPLGPVPPGVGAYTLVSRYDFRIKQLVSGAPVSPTFVPGPNGGTITNPNRMVAGGNLLAAPITKLVSYFDNGPMRVVQYNGALWEWQPVSVVARAIPPTRSTPLPPEEDTILQTELGGASGVQALKAYLTAHDLALLVSRDVTVRGDMQQDFNLKIRWSAHQTPPLPAATKEIAWLQFMEADYVRGYGSSNPGRRALPRIIPSTLNPPVAGLPAGAVKLGDDGSMAAFVPAGRALSWQTLQEDGTPSVRERYWVTFQPGEMRSCKNCHGLNQVDVFGNPPPTNPPQALTDLVRWWRDQQVQSMNRVTNWRRYGDARR